MIRVVLDTNVVVSSLLTPSGTQATVLMLALTGHVALYVSTSVLAEYEEVLRRPRLKLQPRQVEVRKGIKKYIQDTGRLRDLFQRGVFGHDDPGFLWAPYSTAALDQAIAADMSRLRNGRQWTSESYGMPSRDLVRRWQSR